MRKEIMAFMREYYAAGHIVGLNADVMAHKLADRIISKQTDHSMSGRFFAQEANNILCVRAEYATELELRLAILEDKANGTFCKLTNEQLKDALSITHNMMVSTAPSSPRYDEICQHFTELMGIQKARAKL